MYKNRITGLCAIVLGIAIAIYSMTIKVRMQLNEPGPKVFPLIAGVGIAVCGLGLLITEYKTRSDKPFLTKEGWKRFGCSMVILVAYYLGLKLLGFLPATPFVILALSRLFSQKKFNWGIGCIVAVVATD